MSITTLIFDLGSVVLTNDWHDNNENKFQEFRKLYQITNEGMEIAWNVYWPTYEVGRISEDQFWQGFLKESGAKNINIDKAKQLWRKYQKPIEQMPELLKKLKIHYTLAALSNTGKEWLEYKIKTFQINKLFNVIISSSSTGIAKPDEWIYKIIIDKLNIVPEEAIFIDDTQKCLLPAEQLGMQTILFQGQEKFEEKLKELGVI